MFNINYEELREVGFYEYVARHSHEMSKSQLANFVKEISYAAKSYFNVEYGYPSGDEAYKEYVEAEAINQLEEDEV